MNENDVAQITADCIDEQYEHDEVRGKLPSMYQGTKEAIKKASLDSFDEAPV